jgi:putative transposase
MPKLYKWAEDNILEGLIVFGLALCEFNRKRLRTSTLIERLNQGVKQRTKVAKIFANEVSTLLFEVGYSGCGGNLRAVARF